jgi:hypothetical protein
MYEHSILQVSNKGVWRGWWNKIPTNLLVTYFSLACFYDDLNSHVSLYPFSVLYTLFCDCNKMQLLSLCLTFRCQGCFFI